VRPPHSAVRRRASAASVRAVCGLLGVGLPTTGLWNGGLFRLDPLALLGCALGLADAPQADTLRPPLPCGCLRLPCAVADLRSGVPTERLC
jgi:hypothetical protein